MRILSLILLSFSGILYLNAQVIFEYDGSGNITKEQTNLSPDRALEYKMLEELFSSTDGINWTNNSDWIDNCDYCLWYGITCDGDSRVIEIQLDNNNLVGTLPASLGDLERLQQLNLVDNAISGQIPQSIGNLTQLQNLSLGLNSLSGSLPESLCDIPNLSILDLSSNLLEDCFPQCYSTFCNIGYDLSLNPYLPHDGDLSVFCADNTLGCECPTGGDIDALMALYHATDGDNWSNNDGWLSDCVYCNWYGVTCWNGSIVSLSLDFNNLSGPLPDAFFALPELEDLYLAGNNITGTLSPQVANLSSLYNLGLMDNQMSGNLPSEIGDLSNLGEIWIGNNNFDGTLPSTLCNLTDLSVLFGAHNNFNSCFPDCMDVFCGSAWVDFNGNSLLPDNGNFSIFCSDGSSGCSEVCVNKYTSSTNNMLTGDQVYDQLYNADIEIESNQGIVNNVDVTYKAGNQINLLADFEISLGGVFEAIIEGCTSSITN